MNSCPCCHNTMLHHVRSGRTYWFCRTCWQEMPLIHVIHVEPTEVVNSVEPRSFSAEAMLTTR